MCIFCDIVEGKIPSSIIYEDDQIMAFLDISQVTRGHTLVIPKKHCDSFLTCDDETLAHLMKTARHAGGAHHGEDRRGRHERHQQHP